MSLGTYSHIDREAELAAISRAIAIERKARYSDLQGKRSSFSEFMRRSAERLIKRFPMDLRWTTIRGLFRQYPHADHASRIQILRRAEEILFSGKAMAPPELSEIKAEAAGKAKVTGSRPSDKAANAARPKSSPERAKAVAEALKEYGVQAGSAGIESQPGPGLAPVEFGFSAGEKSKSSDINNEKATESRSVPEKSEDLKAVRKSIASKNSEKDPRKTDIQYLRGVGPKLAELLARLKIETVDDLLRHYPRQHLDFQNHLKIRQLQPGQEATVLGTIRSVGAYQAKKSNISILSLSIHDGSGSISISKFVGGRSNKYLLERYKSAYPKGAQVMASGRVERDNYSGRLQLKNAEIELLGALASSDDELDSLHVGRLVPVYPLTEGLSLRYLRGVIHNALEAYSENLADPLPSALLERLNLPDLKTALWGIHFPENIEQKEEARQRLVFDELFMAQIELALRRHRYLSSTEALQIQCAEGKLLLQFKEQLPFKLTGAQERVFNEIAKDLASPKPMHRLVQGDVGSGKTVVAALSALLAIENGFQVAVMAPTEILAEQHYRKFQEWMTPLGIRCGLFLGKQGVRERRMMQQDLVSGQIQVAIGTHALIQDDVEFQKLGFVIIDEQHRFGVKQRAKLKAKGSNPELLTMTATPIPRTLALTVHGDLDVSEIDELPPGRKPIETVLVSDKRKMYTAIKEEILRGRQAYVVFPLIEESETLSAKAATVEFERLRTQVFPEISIGLMHGKLKAQEKDAVMESFRKGEFKILVSTTVIEVGVDVPNATVMVIENADRFGLAQLHQLRGRVGRGAEKSYCYLVADARSEMTKQRLGIMTETNDGFVVAEKDLELRGPGEFLGVRQSGMPEMCLADIVQDAKILEAARKIAIEIVKEDPELSGYPLLKESISARRVSETTELLSSG
ncbi:MAG: ATP-dependent DNA helicase RecG [Candidatus Obscuribacterales bacterium]|nr:ATP-dependent DNA helicase RecG [Candidatus Obscuribacterales bacterium]